MATTITANGINFPDGSASSPSIGGSDTNTGLFTGADIIGFSTGGSERLRIDSSGRLGIGTTSPAGKLDIGGLTNTGGENVDALKITRTDGLQLYGINWDVSANEVSFSGNTKNYVFKNGSSSAETMRIDSSGRLLIGTTTPIMNEAGFNEIVIGGNSEGAAIHLQDDNSNVRGGLFTSDANLAMIVRTVTNHPLTFRTNNTERMRITSGGKFYVGTTNGAFADDAAQHAAIVNSAANVYTLALRNAADSSSGRGLLVAAGNGTGGERLIFFERFDGHTLGSITVAGHSSVAYNTSSDYRLKENVVTLSDGITRLKTLKPSRFNFKENSSRTVDGFLAHEVTAVPEAITGTKDEVDENGDPKYQGIDQSKLVPLLTAALQEAVAKIETLETKVAALEAG